MHDDDEAKRPRLTRWLSETLDGLMGRRSARPSRPPARQAPWQPPGPRPGAPPTTRASADGGTGPAGGPAGGPAIGPGKREAQREAAKGTDPSRSGGPTKELPREAGEERERPPSPDVRSLRWKDPPRGRSAELEPRGAAASKASAPAAPKPEDRDQELKRVKRELADAQLMLMGKEAGFRNEMKELQERNAELLNKIVRLTQRDRELQARIVDAQFDGSGAKAEVKKLDEELRDLRRAYQRKEKELEALTARVEELQRSGAEAEERLGECGEGLEEERQALDAVHARIRENLATVADMTTDRDRLRNRLLGAEDDMATLKEQLRGALTRRAPQGPLPGPRYEDAGSDDLPILATRAAQGATPIAESSSSSSQATRAREAGANSPAPLPAMPWVAETAPPGAHATAKAQIAEALGAHAGLPRPFLVSGPRDAPLFAVAAGQRQEVAHEAQARRARRAELAEATFRTLQERGGIPRLPDAFAETLGPPVDQRSGVQAHGRGAPGEGDRRPSGRGRRGRTGRDQGPRDRPEPREQAGRPERDPRSGGSKGRRPRGHSRDRGVPR